MLSGEGGEPPGFRRSRFNQDNPRKMRGFRLAQSSLPIRWATLGGGPELAISVLLP